MAAKTFSSIAAMLLVPQLVTATSFDYYRSVFCNSQSSSFLIESYTSPMSLADDKLCHQTPAGTMAMKLNHGIAPGCVVLAYDDYGCSNLVGSVPDSGKCVAATKMKIGLWQAVCNDTNSDSTIIQTVAPAELKRRGKTRLNIARDASNSTTSTGVSSTEIPVATASSIVSEISSAISASATGDAAATITSSPSAGAAFSSAVVSGADIDYNLTSYIEATPSAGNGSYSIPSMTTATSPTTMVLYTGKTSSNGTASLQMGTASKSSRQGLIMGVASGLILVFAAMTML